MLTLSEYKIRIKCLLASILLLTNCNKGPDEHSSNTFDLLDAVLSCYVPENRLALFADISSYNRIESSDATTKASEAEKYLLSDLLDFYSLKEKYYSGRLFKQIAFMQNGNDILASIHGTRGVSIEMCVSVKKYLIETTDEDGKSFFYVVTMIPEEEGDDENRGYDFFNKANFSGLCLFSMLDGSHVYLQRYRDGQIFQSLLTNDVDCDIEYLSLMSKVNTKGDDGNVLIPSICIGFRNIWLDPSLCIGWLGNGQGNGNSIGKDGSSGYNGPGNAPDQDSNIPPDERLYPLQDECFLVVVSNLDDEITFPCNGHSYTQGSLVNIVPCYNMKAPILHEFSSWVGDFSKYASDSFTFEIGNEHQYSAIAYYDLQKPCVDRATGKGNPLVKMSIASSASWGNWFGGTFGKTRTDETTGEAKFHAGVDLAADPGTPVFSMLDGVITYIKHDSPNEYVRNSYGNEIRIMSTFNDSTIIIQYAHLQFGNAIAQNPFTGCPLSVGNAVFQGQLIGYTGKTGNATNVPNKHLHLTVKDSNSAYIDPSTIINGDVDAKNQQSKKGKIDNIRCN